MRSGFSSVRGKRRKSGDIFLKPPIMFLKPAEIRRFLKIAKKIKKNLKKTVDKQVDL